MAKKKIVHEMGIVEAIQENNIFTITDVFAFYGHIKKSRFYQLNLDKSDAIQKALEQNKIRTKQTLKRKWLNSDNPTLQIAVFKLICTDEERKLLQTNYHEVDQKTEIHQTVDVNIKQTLQLESLSEEERKLVENIAIKQISSMSGVSTN